MTDWERKRGEGPTDDDYSHAASVWDFGDDELNDDQSYQASAAPPPVE